MVDQAATLALSAGLRAEHLQCLGAQALFEAFSGNRDVALQRVRELRESVSDQDEPGVDVWLAIFHTNILFALNRPTEVQAAAASAIRTATDRGIEQSFLVAMLRWNVASTLISLGQVEPVRELIEPLTQGLPRQSNQLDYEIRALVEMLRGNMYDARQRWAQIDKPTSGATAVPS